MLRSRSEPSSDGQLREGATWTVRVGAFAGLADLIRALGADPISLFCDAGLDLRAFDDPDGRIPYAALAWLLQEAAKRTRCAHFGLLAGQMWHIGDLGLPGELASNSPTVRDALKTFTAHQHLDDDGGLVFLSSLEDVVDFGYAVYHPDVHATGQLYDAVMAASFNALRNLCGPGWLPTEVLLPHVRPVDVGPYRRLFKVQPRFDADVAVLRFPSRWLSRAVDAADPVRLANALQCAEQAEHGDLMQQVTRGLRLLLVQGRSSGDDLAGHLRMHRRTLNRRLRLRGTTFRQLLDRVRLDVAQQLLAESRVSLDDIADVLGYAGVTTFMRRFNRRTGTTPDRYRRGVSPRHRREPYVRSAAPAHAVPFLT